MRFTTTHARFAALSLVLAAAAATGGAAGDASAGGGGCAKPEDEGAGTEVSIAGCFSPTVLRVEPGTRVNFKNTDPYAHVVIGQTWSAERNLTEGMSAEVLFPLAGTFPYACTFHPGMVGVIIVGDGDVQRATDVRAVAAPRLAPATAAAPAVAAVAAPEGGVGAIPGAGWLAIGAALGVAATGAADAAIGVRRSRGGR